MVSQLGSHGQFGKNTEFEVFGEEKVRQVGKNHWHSTTIVQEEAGTNDTLFLLDTVHNLIGFEPCLE